MLLVVALTLLATPVRADSDPLGVCIRDGAMIVMKVGKWALWGRKLEKMRDTVVEKSRVEDFSLAELAAWRTKLGELQAAGKPLDEQAFRSLEGRLAFIETVSPEVAQTLGLGPGVAKLPKAALNWIEEFNPWKWNDRRGLTALQLTAAEQDLARFTGKFGLNQREVGLILSQLFDAANPMYKRVPRALEAEMPVPVKRDLADILVQRTGVEDITQALKDMGLFRDPSVLDRFLILRKRFSHYEDGLLSFSISVAASATGNFKALILPTGRLKRFAKISPADRVEFLRLGQDRGFEFLAKKYPSLKWLARGDQAWEIARVTYNNAVRMYFIALLVRALPATYQKAKEYYADFMDEPDPEATP